MMYMRSWLLNSCLKMHGKYTNTTHLDSKDILLSVVRLGNCWHLEKVKLMEINRCLSIQQMQLVNYTSFQATLNSDFSWTHSWIMTQILLSTRFTWSSDSQDDSHLIWDTYYFLPGYTECSLKARLILNIEPRLPPSSLPCNITHKLRSDSHLI